MQRIARWTRLKPGLEAEYIRTHREIWPKMKAAIAEAGMRNYSCYIHGRELYSYFECEDVAAVWAYLENQPIAREWQETMAHLMDVEDEVMPWQTLEEVFHLN